MNQYVYVLECAGGSWYTGWTNNLRGRLNAHFGGSGAKYTRAHKPVRLVYAQAFADKQEAQRFEYAFKQLSRPAKEKLVRERRKENPAEDMRVGHIFYLMGKSATGKDHLYEALLSDPDLRLKPLVLYTTRPMRKGERDGIEYHFTDEEGLESLRQAGKVVEERAYQTVQGIWHYFTVDDDAVDLTWHDYLAIGTPESFGKLRRFYGKETVIPLYIQTEDRIRLERAMKREAKQPSPDYEEMCRRFLADQKDFSEKKLERAGIYQRFENNSSLGECIGKLKNCIQEQL